jgi:hypothetical protein
MESFCEGDRQFGVFATDAQTIDPSLEDRVNP